ncbi:unnamed protein product [Eretmochelys imbricata]
MQLAGNHCSLSPILFPPWCKSGITLLEPMRLYWLQGRFGPIGLGMFGPREWMAGMDPLPQCSPLASNPWLQGTMGDVSPRAEAKVPLTSHSALPRASPPRPLPALSKGHRGLWSKGKSEQTVLASAELLLPGARQALANTAVSKLYCSLLRLGPAPCLPRPLIHWKPTALATSSDQAAEKRETHNQAQSWVQGERASSFQCAPHTPLCPLPKETS